MAAFRPLTVLQNFTSMGLNFVLPPRCPGCGVQTGSLGGLCPTCWTEKQFLADPCCNQCGYPFELDFGEGTLCGACLSQQPCYDRARAALAYDEAVARIIIGFKHGDRTDLAPTLARWMIRAGRELLADADILLPVPLHPRRLRQRRYNQSVLLAKPLARALNLPLETAVLIRHRQTPSQGHLSLQARRRNVEGAFRTKPENRSRIAGKKLLLIDDVFTTGATVDAIARRLKKDGAKTVDVLTLARVVRETAVI